MFDIRKPDQFKAAVRASFNATLPTYGTDGDYHWAFAQRLVERAPLRREQHVLDVATGTGPAAIMAARVVGSEGRVVGIDLAPGILELAWRNIAAASLRHIEVRVGDAEQLDFPDRHFDGILCSSSIVWFPDIPRALREWRRALRLGGWIAFSCFGGAARATVVGLLSRLLADYGRVLPELNERLNSPVKCRRLVRAAGFDRVEVSIAQEQAFPTDPEESFDQVWAGRTRYNIELPPVQLARLRSQYVAEFSRLLQEQQAWNHDYEQFVVAYKGTGDTADH